MDGERGKKQQTERKIRETVKGTWDETFNETRHYNASPSILYQSNSEMLLTKGHNQEINSVWGFIRYQ